MKFEIITYKNGITSISGFSRPFGITKDPDKNIIVTDMDYNLIFRFSTNLKFVSYLGSISNGWKWSNWQSIDSEFNFNEEKSHLHGPHSIDFFSNGNIYVTNYYTPGIHIISSDGNLIKNVTVVNSDKLKGPATSFFASDQTLWVAEYGLSRTINLNYNGQYIRDLIVPSNHKVNFDRLHMIKESIDNMLYVVDTWNNEIKIFNYSGNLIKVITDHLNIPVAISFNKDGDYAITNWQTGIISFYNKNDSYYGYLSNQKLQKPYDAQFIDNQFAIADSHNGRIILFDNVNEHLSYQ